MRNFVAVILLFCFAGVYAQPGPAFTFKGEIKNFPRPGMVYLLSVEGSGYNVVDSMYSKEGRILFISDTLPLTGQYSLFWADENFLNFVFHQETYIQFSADHLDPGYNVDILASRENEVYYYLQRYEVEIDSLSQLGDQYYEQGKGELLSQLKRTIGFKVLQLQHDVDSIEKAFPGLFSIKIYRSSIPPDFDAYAEANPEHGYSSEYDFLKRHYFDNIDKNDSCLVRTRVLFDACSFYLQNLVDDQKPETYSKACDFIVSSFSWNNAQYEYILNLLLNTFENEGFEEVYLHLFDFYMNSASCEGGIPNEQERKALAIRNLKKGSPAPQLTAKDREGKTHSLSDYTGKKVLVMFWESSCSHCEEAIPYVLDLLKKYPDVVLFSFSLDENDTRWVGGILSHNLPEPSVSDLLGYDGPNAIRWCVWGTPSFFVIDTDGNIVSKPPTLKALQDAL